MTAAQTTREKNTLCSCNSYYSVVYIWGPGTQLADSPNRSRRSGMSFSFSSESPPRVYINVCMRGIQWYGLKTRPESDRTGSPPLPKFSDFLLLIGRPCHDARNGRYFCIRFGFTCIRNLRSDPTRLWVDIYSPPQRRYGTLGGVYARI